MDRLTPLQRSINMSKIKSENTSQELYIFNELKKLGIKFKRHYKTYGKPDIAFPDKKIAVFINGEFWHGKNYKSEKNSYKDFWIEKIQKNINRDKKNYKLLKNEGWTVIKIWDKDLKKNPEKEIGKIIRALSGITPD